MIKLHTLKHFVYGLRCQCCPYNLSAVGTPNRKHECKPMSIQSFYNISMKPDLQMQSLSKGCYSCCLPHSMNTHWTCIHVFVCIRMKRKEKDQVFVPAWRRCTGMCISRKLWHKHTYTHTHTTNDEFCVRKSYMAVYTQCMQSERNWRMDRGWQRQSERERYASRLRRHY